jgi:uncharacterized protein (TIGR02145 family)
MHCKECGNQIENYSKFCSFCGAKQELIGQIYQTQQSINQVVVNQNTVKDIDGNVYQTICIGNQTWMVENLKVSRYRNGDPIPNIKNDKEWSELNIGGWCNYANDISFDSNYGKLYNFFAVDDKRGLAPQGWHVPSDEEWDELILFLDGIDLAGGKLKEAGLIHWKSPNVGATNKSGFNALPGGSRSYEGMFEYISERIYLWSSCEAWYRFIYNDNSRVQMDCYCGKKSGFSVRCIKDSDVYNEVPKLQMESNSNITHKLSPLEAYNELQANCNFVEESVKIQLPQKGRVNLLVFNLYALSSILDEDFDNGRDGFLIEFTDLIISYVSSTLNMSAYESKNYIGKKIEDYDPLLKVLVDKDQFKAKTLELEFFMTELEFEQSLRFRLSLAILSSLFINIADNI